MGYDVDDLLPTFSTRYMDTMKLLYGQNGNYLIADEQISKLRLNIRMLKEVLGCDCDTSVKFIFDAVGHSIADYMVDSAT